MSTAEPGGNGVARGMLGDSKALLEAGAAAEEQLNLLEAPTPEEMAEAREALGDGASRLEVLREARQRSRGRPKGARNKRTDDFARYILGFGQDPAITLIQIASTPPEVLIQASEQEKVHSFSKDGTARIVTER